MIKNAVFGLLVILLAFSFIGCDNGNGDNNEVFTSSTNETISNDTNSLGLVGTTVSSSNENVAIAAITSGKVKITSIGNGSTIITVSEGLKNATINVTVSSTGNITIGNITKYIAPEFSKLIISNITGFDNSKYLAGYGLIGENALYFVSVEPTQLDFQFPKGAVITSNTINLNVYITGIEDYTFSLFTENCTIAAGDLALFVLNKESPTNDGADYDSYYTNKTPIIFSNGNASIDFGIQMEKWANTGKLTITNFTDGPPSLTAGNLFAGKGKVNDDIYLMFSACPPWDFYYRGTKITGNTIILNVYQLLGSEPEDWRIKQFTGNITEEDYTSYGFTFIEFGMAGEFRNKTPIIFTDGNAQIDFANDIVKY